MKRPLQHRHPDPSKRPYKKTTVAILLLLSYLCLTAGQVSAKLAGTVMSPAGSSTSNLSSSPTSSPAGDPGSAGGRPSGGPIVGPRGSRLAPELIEALSGSQAAHLALAFAIGTYFFFLLRGLLWVFLLRKLKLVLAYPLMSLGYVLVLAASFLLFKEALTLNKLAGALLIMTGVSLVSLGEVRQKKKEAAE